MAADTEGAAATTASVSADRSSDSGWVAASDASVSEAEPEQLLSMLLPSVDTANTDEELSGGGVQRPAEPAERMELLPGATGRDDEGDDFDEVGTVPASPIAPGGENANMLAGVLAAKKLAARKRWRRASVEMALIAAKTGPSKKPHLRQQLEPEMWAEFRRLYKDDGLLDARDLGTLFARLGVKATSNQISLAMPLLDPERTGQISLGRLVRRKQVSRSIATAGKRKCCCHACCAG